MPYYNQTKLFFLITFTLLILFTPFGDKTSLFSDEIINQKTIQRISYSTSSFLDKNKKGSKALDDNLKTAWTSLKKNNPHWFTLDFGIKRIITGIKIIPAQYKQEKTLKFCLLQFQYKGDWFDFCKIDFNNKSIPKIKKINLGGIDASKLRIYIPEEATLNQVASLAEIEIYVGQAKIIFYDKRLKNLFFPIRNGLFPENEALYPNAPRAYRGGRHVGIDFYNRYSPSLNKIIPISKETGIYAIQNGQIIRSDLDYKPLTPQQWYEQSKYYQKNPATFVKRSFGGRQVWIDHQNGIVSTYNHLSEIYTPIKKGTWVKKGDLIGWAGNSGLLDEARKKNKNIHLHMEIWVDGYYLGWGMAIKEIKQYFEFIFSAQD